MGTSRKWSTVSSPPLFLYLVPYGENGIDPDTGQDSVEYRTVKQLSRSLARSYEFQDSCIAIVLCLPWERCYSDGLDPVICMLRESCGLASVCGRPGGASYVIGGTGRPGIWLRSAGVGLPGPVPRPPGRIPGFQARISKRGGPQGNGAVICEEQQ